MSLETKQKPPQISIVIPVYKSANCIEALHAELKKWLTPWTHEIIFVNDGSPDNSLYVLSQLVELDSTVKVLDLSRNFGQHAAVTAGLSVSAGDYTVVMDCDLQHHPKFLPSLIEQAQAGNDIVLTSFKKRSSTGLRNLGARFFGYVIASLSGDTKYYQESIGNYSLLQRKVVQAFLMYGEIHRHYLFILRDLGFKWTVVQIEHQARFAGTSSYNMVKLIKHAIDGIVSRSSRLLYISTSMGFLCLILSILFMIDFVYKYFTSSLLPGWLSTVFLITLFSGINLLSIGILGLYVGKIFEQVKGRPLFIIKSILQKERKT